MAEVAKTIYLSINSTDLSDYVREARLESGAEMIDATTLGSDTGQNFIAGLKTFTLTVELVQDFSNVDAVISPLVGADPFPVSIRPSSGLKSATNPEWSGNFVLESYTPIALRVGELQVASVTLRPAGAITRSTS